MKNCVVCALDCSEWSSEALLRSFNICKKCRKKLTDNPREAIMECSFCGSQSTTFKEGISKTGKNAGRPWKAYDCDEPNCKNDKGYPNRTFVPNAKTQGPSPMAKKIFQGPQPTSTVEKKLDEILRILKNEFPQEEKKYQDQEPF